ncbi:MAG: response regulator [Cyclobacteriaceae bacterium]|nr:response regulator [Cyclobacteriaceae bacterium]
MLLAEESNEEKRDAIQGIINAAKRATSLTQKLLAFGRRGKNLTEAVELNKIVPEVIAILSHSIDKNIEIETNLQPDLSTFDGDSSQIHQVIMNLCVNASDSMQNGGKLTITTKEIEFDVYISQKSPELKEGKYILLQVKDSGTGIDDEVLKHIYEPFFTTKKDGEIIGTGLGLATVYGIVKTHFGVIDIDTGINKGTSFNIYFPKGIKEIEVRNKIKAVDDIKQKEGLIMIVDDEEIILSMLKRMIKILGYSTIITKNGQEAIEIYKERFNEIKLVIIDMQMPIIGGKEAFIKMKEINPNIVALLSTGYGHNERAQEILDLGAKDLLLKPYKIEEIREKIDKML